MRWREKFCLVKICWNEVGDNIPYTLCIPRLPPFYNFFPPHHHPHPYPNLHPPRHPVPILILLILLLVPFLWSFVAVVLCSNINPACHVVRRRANFQTSPLAFEGEEVDAAKLLKATGEKLEEMLESHDFPLLKLDNNQDGEDALKDTVDAIVDFITFFV